MNHKMRIEPDSMGPVSVPSDAYFGPQTARAISNFRLSGVPISSLPDLLHALALIKLASVRANRASSDMPTEKADAIEAACQDVLAGGLNDWFPLDVFQGGAGTSTNMNMNEVLANRALEHLGVPKGRYDIIHPNDDVNMSQSTNDVYPTAVRLAVLIANKRLSGAVEKLAVNFRQKAEEFKDISKLGRTQLQDAVPMSLGAEFSAFATAFEEDAEKLDQVAGIFLEINLGGTAIGTSINANAGYRSRVVRELGSVAGFPFVAANNLIEASWDTGAFVLYSGMLKRVAIKLSKVANDLRLLASGPRGGLGEISLPAMQPGSSIMPGKVNPVIPEMVNQAAFFVAGTDMTITMASEAGQLQLNAFEPVIAYGLLTNLKLLTNAVDALSENCVAGIEANVGNCMSHLDASMAYATVLAPVLGYQRAAELAKEALRTGQSLRQVLACLPDGLRDKAYSVLTTYVA